MFLVSIGPGIRKTWVSLVLLLIFQINIQTEVFSQSDYGTLTGKIYDGRSGAGLTGVSIVADSTAKSTVSLAGGVYYFQLLDGKHLVTFSYPGYQTKAIRLIDIRQLSSSTLDILLYPVAFEKQNRPRDFLFVDSVMKPGINTFIAVKSEISSVQYNVLTGAHSIFDKINSNEIKSGTDRDAVSVLSRLHQVIPIGGQDGNPNYNSLLIAGMGARYNQVMLNGAGMTSAGRIQLSFPLGILPAEAIASVTVNGPSSAAVPANFGGGTIELKTRDLPDHDFFVLQIGGGFTGSSSNKDFLGDRRNSYQFLSFPGSIRNLPGDFPTTKSRVFYVQKNVQEQVDHSRSLNNNLAPENYGKTIPDDRILLGFGKIRHYKKGLTIGVTGFVNHLRNQSIDDVTVQVLPNVQGNPFPFADLTQKALNSQSQDINYNYSAQMAGMLNASFLWRNNKISIRNYLGSQFFSTLSSRDLISKPDESTAATNAIRHTTEQTRFIYSQIAGEHSFGVKNNFLVDWQLTVNLTDQKNPDERSFLLERSSTQADLYRIAEPVTPPFNPVRNVGEATFAPNFTYSSRIWRSSRNNMVTGSVNVRLPFNLMHKQHVLGGGLYMQNMTMNFISDLLLVRGGDFTTLDNIIAPQRYFPGGVTVTNYFSNIDRVGGTEPVTQPKLANYFGSSNVAAAYLQMENGIARKIRLQWGLRLESGNIASAIVQYEYAPGYRYPQRFSTESNSRQVSYKLLPSASILYLPLKSLQLDAGYSRTLNRPVLQELTRYNYYDASTFMVQTGNPFLSEAVIDNLRAGLRYLVGSGTHLSLHGFLKQIDRPIEEVIFPYSAGTISSMPFNMPSARVYGIEADLKFQFSRISSSRWLSKLSMFASGNINRSKVDAGPIRNTFITHTESHDLSGTPGYSMNAGIILQDTKFPEFSIIYSTTGDYIARVGFGEVIALANGESVKAVPDYRVKGQGHLNIQVAQRFLRSRVQLIAGLNNILNNPTIIYQDLNGNGKYDGRLFVTSGNTDPGFYRSGTDNVVTHIRSQRNYYFRFSYNF